MKSVLIILLLVPFSLIAQTVAIRGVVREGKEELPMAHITVLPDSTTAVSDAKGRFALSLRPGLKQVVVSYTGFETTLYSFFLSRDTTLTFALRPRSDELNAIVVTANRAQTKLFESTRSGTNILSSEEINAIPVLGGEADLIKVLQLLPGTIRGVEGTSDIFVRGGAADQNLVLLDEATVYNTSHLFGFVSVFNPDIIKSVESINGSFPATVGGRLSSILHVNTHSEIATKTRVSGNIGLIASRLFIEQPIIKNKVSVWVAARRTYIDQVVKLVNQQLPYLFYDINAKLSVRPTDRDLLSFSMYSGDDLLDIFRDRNNDGIGSLTSFQPGNTSQTFQWTRQLSKKWYSTFTALRTAYQYDIQNAFRTNRLKTFSNITDVGAKVLFGTNEGVGKGSVKFGLDWTHHNVSPSVVSTTGLIAEFLAGGTAPGRAIHEMALFGQYERSFSDRWLLTAGLRTSFAFTGERNYVIPEPRFSARYEINPTQALKFSYSRMAQYLHRISNSAVTAPTDIWYPVTKDIQPQTAHQFSVAWQKTLPKTGVFISVESYYKPMNNLIGLEEGTNLFFNTDFEKRLVQGKGNAYGFEFLVKKELGNLTGWISYTLSWSNRQFDAVNQGVWFPSRYDRRHNGAIVTQYALHPRWAISAVWEFISGSKFTPVIGQYGVMAPSTTGLDLIPIYAPINSVKLADSHRLDLGVKFKSKPERKFKTEWFAGVYNVYNRANPVGITVQINEDGSMKYEQPGLFGLLPFISYGFKF